MFRACEILFMRGIIGQTTHLTAFDFIILTSKYLNTLYRKVIASLYL